MAEALTQHFPDSTGLARRTLALSSTRLTLQAPGSTAT